LFHCSASPDELLAHLVDAGVMSVRLLELSSGCIVS
jgi:hypothetical protein